MSFTEIAAHRAIGADVAAALEQYNAAIEAGAPEAIAMCDRRLREAAQAMARASQLLSSEDRRSIAASKTKPIARFGTVHAPAHTAHDPQPNAPQRLARNRRTPGLYCEHCDTALPIGTPYVLIESVAMCRPCARRFRNTPTSNAPYRRPELTPDALAKRIDDLDVPSRSGAHTAPQSAADDLLDQASTRVMVEHRQLRRTVHQYDNSSPAEQNTDPIDEIEDETTPDVPDWTPTYWPRRPFTVKQIAPGVDGLGRPVEGAVVLGDRWCKSVDNYAHLGIPSKCARLAAPRIGPHLYQRADD